MNDNDAKTEFEEAYDSAFTYWSGFLSEAKEDLSYMLGSQWDAAARKYLERQRRSALVFNKIRRVVKLIEGFQRKNRLSLKISPVEGADEQTADIFSALLLWQMQSCNGYHVLSDAFSSGVLKTGINLIQTWVDYSQDPLNGDLKLTRIPYNQFLLDPNFTERDLSNCGYICRREYMTKDALRSILPPESRRAIKDISPKGIMDNKYLNSATKALMNRKDIMRYDEYWRRVYKDVTIIADRTTGQMLPWDQGKGDKLHFALDLMRQQGGQPEVMEIVQPSIELVILVEDIVVHKGPEPNGLNDFPFVPVMGFFDAEYDEAKDKLQGIVRCMRDPQTEVNKRRSKMLDMMDSQLTTGWKALKGSVVNPDVLFQSGQGKTVWIDKNAPAGLNSAEQLRSAEIPQGMFQLSAMMDKDIMEIPGANSELMGMPESDNIEVAGMLAKQRMGQGVTILQDILDNFSLANKLVGQKMLQLIQTKFSPTKVQRITGRQPTKEFFDNQFGKYDCFPEEGLLTDSQRQMYFSQLVALRQMGAPIPWIEIIEASPMESKGKLKEAIKAAEQQKAKAEQAQLMMTQLQVKMGQAKIQEMNAEQQREIEHAKENRQDAKYKEAKTLAEIQKMGLEEYRKHLAFLREQQLLDQQELAQATQPLAAPI